MSVEADSEDVARLMAIRRLAQTGLGDVEVEVRSVREAVTVSFSGRGTQR